MKQIIFFLCFFLGSVITTSAQNDYFLKIEGIDGESKDASHKDWIDIESFSRGVQRDNGSATGQTRRRGAPIFIDLCVTKKADKATVPIERAVIRGENIRTATLEITRNIGGAKKVYLKYEFQNVSVTNYSIEGEEPNVPIENFCLSFRKIKVTYISYDQKGAKSGEEVFEWNIEQNTGN